MLVGGCLCVLFVVVVLFVDWWWLFGVLCVVSWRLLCVGVGCCKLFGG